MSERAKSSTASTIGTESDGSKQLSSEEIQDFKDTFALFDKDGSGTISASELGSIMRSLGQNATDDELADMISEVDIDQSGTIDFDEFLKLMSASVKPADSAEEARAAFKIFDRDNSGTIDAEELRQVMRSLGENVTDQEIDEMIAEADKDANGTIDYEEFVQFLAQK